MKILLFATHYNDQIFTRRRLISRLAESVDEIVICTPDAPFSQNIVKGTRFARLEGERASSSLRSNISMLLNIRRIIAIEAPQLILTVGLQPRIFVGFLNLHRKYVAVSIVNGRGRFYEPAANTLGRLKRAIGRAFASLAYRGYSGFVVQNGDDQELFSKLTHARILKVGGSGVDTKFFKPNPGSKNPRNFLMVARALQAKGLEDLLQVLQCDMTPALDPAKICLVVSDIENSNVPDNMLKSLETIGVELLEAPQDITKLLSESRYALLPSYQEGCPRFLLEAMSSGVPLIAYDAVGSRDLIPSSEYGWLVPLKSISALHRAMTNATTCDPETYQSMSQTVRHAAEHRYDRDLVENQVSEFILKLRSS